MACSGQLLKRRKPQRHIMSARAFLSDCSFVQLVNNETYCSPLFITPLICYTLNHCQLKAKVNHRLTIAVAVRASNKHPQAPPNPEIDLYTVAILAQHAAKGVKITSRWRRPKPAFILLTDITWNLETRAKHPLTPAYKMFQNVHSRPVKLPLCQIHASSLSDVMLPCCTYMYMYVITVLLVFFILDSSLAFEICITGEQFTKQMDNIK